MPFKTPFFPEKLDMAFGTYIFNNIIFYEKQMIDCIEIVENTRKKILGNNNYEMSVDYLLMNCYKIYNKI